MQSEMQSEIMNMQKEINMLREENEKCVQALIKHSKDRSAYHLS